LAAMLGRFLEVSVATPRILDSWHFYQRLGFTAANTTDACPHPYAALTDGRVAVGLHELPAAGTVLSFVLPELARHVDRLGAAGVEFERRVLGEDAFNEVEFVDPDGHRVRLLEARTFSPPAAAASGALGWFEEVALPVADLERARDFWERLGFVTAAEGQEPWPHLALTSDTLGLGLYRTADLAAPTLLFSDDDPGRVRQQLAAAGVEPEAQLPRALDPARYVLVVAPEATPLLIAPSPGWP
jgi:catechol 2,3-dioxygenase-like lactoylglutathione lyase family enzyme